VNINGPSSVLLTQLSNLNEDKLFKVFFLFLLLKTIYLSSSNLFIETEPYVIPKMFLTILQSLTQQTYFYATQLRARKSKPHHYTRKPIHNRESTVIFSMRALCMYV